MLECIQERISKSKRRKKVTERKIEQEAARADGSKPKRMNEITCLDVYMSTFYV